MKIKVGDYVKVEDSKGKVRDGKVLSVSFVNCDEDGGWQIEFIGEGGYSHWKQWDDGGFIIQHNSKPKEG